MDELIRGIVEKYNVSYNRCVKNAASLEAAKNNYICATEKLTRMNISQRLRENSYVQHNENENPFEHQSLGMCGCRLTAKLIFILLYLKTIDINHDVNEVIDRLYHTEPINAMNYIISAGFLPSGNNDNTSETVSAIERRDVVPGVYYSLPAKTGIYLVQILRSYGFLGFQPLHTFVIYIDQELSCYIISSWYSGKEPSPLNLEIKPYEMVDEFLTGIDNGIINNDLAMELFNNEILDGRYRTIYFSSEFVESIMTGGKRNRRSKKFKKNMHLNLRMFRKKIYKKSKGKKISKNKRSATVKICTF